ncbi:integrin alpha [candidate division KSB1 bacterium]
MKKRTILTIIAVIFLLSFSLQQTGKLSLFYRISGDKKGILFGKSIGFYHDMDGDGVDEVAVGAPTAGKTGEGEVYIFFSSRQKNIMRSSEAALTLNGAYTGNMLGWMIDSGYDINGDNINDLMVSGLGNKVAPGNVLVFYGKNEGMPSSNFSPDVIITSENIEEFFGQSICSNGDFNGDGINDLVVGAGFLNSAKAPLTGKVYIFYGGKLENRLSTADADIEITGEKNEKLGNSVSFIGDINGDGKDELAAGAFMSEDDSGMILGRTYIFSYSEGKKDFISSDAGAAIAGENDMDNFGTSIYSLGDLDGDNLGDFIVSANSDGKAGRYTGKVYLFRGKTVSSNISAKNADLIYEGNYAYCEMGSGFGMLGNRLLITGPGKVQMPSSFGGLFCLDISSLKDKNKNKFELLYKSPAPGTGFGNEMKVYDLDKDGNKEIFVGAYIDNINGDKSGSIYVYKIK